jgi:hypothetical protein
MTLQSITRGLIRSLIIGLLITIAPTPSWAQDDNNEPFYVTVRLHTVKPDQTAAWESIMKERRDVEKAAGREFRRVFERIRGSGFGYLILHPDLNMGSTDIAASEISPTWGDRLDKALASSTVLTLQDYPDISANLDRWLKKDTDLLRVRLRTTAPTDQQAYHDWQANELAPAHRKGGTVLRVGRVILGGNINTWVRMYVQSDWASIRTGNPVLDNDPEFPKMIARGNEMVVSSQNLLYQYRADLSFSND